MRLLAGLAVAAGLLLAGSARAETRADSLRRELRDWKGRVTYLAGPTVYVNAGRLDGLLSGDTLSLWRGSSRVALVRVDALASHRATCDTLNTSGELRLGDDVRFIGGGIAPASPEPAVAPMAEAVPLAPAKANAHRIRGRVGLQYLSVATEDGASFSQPMLDVRAEERLDHMTVALDVRARRTVTTASDGASNARALSRVHRASLLWGGAQGLRGSFGRQSAPSLGVVSVFDGALVERRGRRWSMGAFAGTQPEPLRMRVNSAIREFGGYIESSSPPVGADRWSVTLGGIASYDHGAPDREFLYLQGAARRGPVNGFFSQEVDFQRAWERSLGEPAVSFSSGYASVVVQAHRTMSVSLGVDNRRRVRLWRDRETPETQFDDTYRQGTWVGTSWSPLRAVRLSGDVRSLRGGEAADTYSWSADLLGRGRWAPYLRTRISQLQSRSTENDLWSGGLGFSPWSGAQLGWSSGARQMLEVVGGLRSRSTWNEVTLDTGIGPRWYATGSFNEERSDGSTMRQLSAGLNWRF